jgi:N-acetylglutamate synthase
MFFREGRSHTFLMVTRIPIPDLNGIFSNALVPDVEAIEAFTGAPQEDGGLYQKSPAAGFEAPEEIFEDFSTPSLLEGPGMTAYVAEVDGVAVATSFAGRVDDQLGVFNVSVVPEHRRRGYGKAVTAAVLRDGYSTGARTAFLTSTEDGFPLYKSMGFRTAESWTSFTAG